MDREFVTQYGLFDETLSWYFGANVERLYGGAKNYDSTDARVREFHHLFTINGYMEGNGPMLTMKEGERVRWYVFSGLNEQGAWDIHRRHDARQSGHLAVSLSHARPLRRRHVHAVPGAAALVIAPR